MKYFRFEAFPEHDASGFGPPFYNIEVVANGKEYRLKGSLPPEALLLGSLEWVIRRAVGEFGQALRAEAEARPATASLERRDGNVWGYSRKDSDGRRTFVYCASEQDARTKAATYGGVVENLADLDNDARIARAIQFAARNSG